MHGQVLYEAGNHVVATLYKIEYANNKGWWSPSCTETACQWNQSTKKYIEPKRITELFVRKSLRTKQENTCETSREETRMKHLLEFDPRIESHKEFCQKHFESFLGKFKKINQGAVIFKSFVLKQMLLIRQKSVLWMQTFRRYVVTSYPSYKSKPILTDV